MINEAWDQYAGDFSIPLQPPLSGERLADFIERVSREYQVEQGDRIKGRISQGSVMVYIVRERDVA